MPKALIVDDDCDLRKVFAMSMAEHGLEVTEAGNGREAIIELCRATVDSALFDVVLLDVAMPIINGTEVLKAMEANPLWENIPVIVFTAAATSSAEISDISQHDVIYTSKGSGCMEFVSTVVRRLVLP